MNSWKWNEEEDRALDELHCARHEKLYLRGLRKFMDYETGIVGLKRVVCEQGMYELLEELRERGSRVPEFKPSRHVIQRMLKKLESVGLVRRLPKAHKKDRMVFFLPLACVGKFSPEEDRTRSALGGAHIGSPYGSGSGGGLAAQAPHNDERTTSGTSGYTSNTNNITSAVDKFLVGDHLPSMSGCWVVDNVVINLLVKKFGFSDSFLRVKVEEFRLYWSDSGGGCDNWSARFFVHVQYCLLTRREAEYVLAAGGFRAVN